MLEIRGLTVRRGKRPALENVSLSLPAGQLAGVLGLNGAGKTTLLHAVLGFCPVVSGTIEVDGQPMKKLSAAGRAKKISYVPQNYQGGFRFSVEEFVSMGATAYLGAFSQPGKDSLTKAAAILERLGCSHLLGRGMDTLSGGERRMAYLARAVMQDAPYMLLDEPVDSLDFSRQHGFLTSLREYTGEKGAGCLMTIHDPALAYCYCDRLILLHEGRVLADISLDKPGSREALADGLGCLYGSRTQVSFNGGRLVMGWDKNIFSKT